MWIYEKRLQYPVKITQTNAKLAQVIMSQFGGPDGELAASMRYLSQRYTMPYKEVTEMLFLQFSFPAKAMQQHYVYSAALPAVLSMPLQVMVSHQESQTAMSNQSFLSNKQPLPIQGAVHPYRTYNRYPPLPVTYLSH